MSTHLRTWLATMLLSSAVILTVRHPVDSALTNSAYAKSLECLDQLPDVTGEDGEPCDLLSSQNDAERNANPQLLRLKGFIALYHANPDEALVFFDQVLATQYDPITQWGEGRAHEMLGNYEQAIWAMQRAGNEDYVLEHLKGEDTRIDLEQFAREAIEVDEHTAEAYLFLGRRQAQRAPDQAITFLTRAARIASEPDTMAAAHYLIGELTYTKKPELASEHFRKAVSAAPADVYLHFDIAKFYLDQAQDSAEAGKWTVRMATAFPDASLTNDMLGWLAWLGGDEQTALNYYRKATENGDSTIQPWTYARQGNIYFALGKYEEAEKSYQNALALTKTGSIPISLQLARAKLEQEDCSGARAALVQMINDANEADASDSRVQAVRDVLNATCGSSG